MVEKKEKPGLHPGQLVVSIQGRDSGNNYLFLGFDSDGFLLVADGVKRTPERPKKKNLRHVKVYPVVDQEIEKKIASGRRVTSEEICQALARMEKKIEKGG